MKRCSDSTTDSKVLSRFWTWGLWTDHPSIPFEQMEICEYFKTSFFIGRKVGYRSIFKILLHKLKLRTFFITKVYHSQITVVNWNYDANVMRLPKILLLAAKGLKVYLGAITKPTINAESFGFAMSMSNRSISNFL